MDLDKSDRLAALFLKSAHDAPDRVAVRDSGGAWTYSEVAAAAAYLADRLAIAGVTPGDRVGVMASRRAGGPVAILAVLWSGATYVPIDPSWPTARRAAVLQGAQAQMVLAVDTARDTPEGVQRLDLTTPELFQTRSTALSSPRPRPYPGAAYIIFTSGSTGAPKGVEVRSAAAAGLVASVVSLIGLGPDCVFVALSSFAFDISVFEIFGPWSVGGELVVAAEMQILANQLGSLLEAPGKRVFLQTTPTVLGHLLQTGLDLPAGTTLMLAGERLPRSLVAQVAHVEQVWNLYGPTETTIYATAHACLPLAPDGSEPDLPIGTAINGAVLEIRPLSDASGEFGELLIGGPGVALGYFGRPELTAERFLDGGSRYVTGDVVRRRADGLLVHAGRLDRQVKIRGNRVELDEVEAALTDLVGHGRVAVRMDAHRVAGPQLAAFVADSRCDVRELRRQLADRLPAYMVPTRIHLVTQIPTTSSGKTDHSALRAPQESGARDEAVFDLGAPRGTAMTRSRLNGPAAVPETVRRLFDDAYGIADRPCVEDRTGLMTRGELRARSAALSEKITSLVGRGALVAVLCSRDRDFVSSVLAVHLGGGAYLPLDTSHPDERLSTVLTAARPDLTLTTSDLAARLQRGTAALLVDTGEVLGTIAECAPRCAGLAYITFTSGTTGRPKGVAIPHSALRAYFHAVDREIGQQSDQVWLAVSSVTFDSSVGEILWPAVTGHMVRLGDNRLPDLVDMAADPMRRLTHMQCASTLLRLLVAEPDAAARIREADTLFVGGEPFPLEVVPALRTGGRGPRLINAYGPTETTVWVSRCDVTPDTVEPVSIGTTSEGHDLRILDDRLEPVADGEPGMLWVSGPQVATGYWDDPVLTAQAFIPDPFADSGTRMYRTGDIAKVTPGGIVIIGRADDQVKIQGNRVEVGEVERALRTVPGVHDAVCLVDRIAPGGTILVGVCAGAGIDSKAVRRHLAAFLPGYMVPSRVVVRDSLPLTPASKVDRRRLVCELGFTDG